MLLLLLHVSLLSWSGLCHIPNLGKHKPRSQYHHASAFYCKYSTVMKISDTQNQRYGVLQYVPDIIISWTNGCRISCTCICLVLNFCICVCVCLCICARCGGEGSPPPSYKWYHESSNLSLDLGERGPAADLGTDCLPLSKSKSKKSKHFIVCFSTLLAKSGTKTWTI